MDGNIPQPANKYTEETARQSVANRTHAEARFIEMKKQGNTIFYSHHGTGTPLAYLDLTTGKLTFYK